jgi:preprotein translocase SecE subunit
VHPDAAAGDDGARSSTTSSATTASVPPTSSRVTRSRTATSTRPSTRGASAGGLVTFIGHCIDELRRVQWPNRRQVGQATAVVLGFVVIAGGYLGLLDALWQPLVEAIL